jgi:hypothetical protein
MDIPILLALWCSIAAAYTAIGAVAAIANITVFDVAGKEIGKAVDKVVLGIIRISPALLIMKIHRPT